MPLRLIALCLLSLLSTLSLAQNIADDAANAPQVGDTKQLGGDDGQQHAKDNRQHAPPDNGYETLPARQPAGRPPLGRTIRLHRLRGRGHLPRRVPRLRGGVTRNDAPVTA